MLSKLKTIWNILRGIEYVRRDSAEFEVKDLQDKIRFLIAEYNLCDKEGYFQFNDGETFNTSWDF